MNITPTPIPTPPSTAAPRPMAMIPPAATSAAAAVTSPAVAAPAAQPQPPTTPPGEARGGYRLTDALKGDAALARHETPWVPAGRAELLTDEAQVIPHLVERIGRADVVNISQYIFLPTGSANGIIDALHGALDRGAQVNLVIDSGGSLQARGTPAYRAFEQLRTHGAQVFRSSGFTDHRKLVTMRVPGEGWNAYVGGMGFGGPLGMFRTWHDYMVRLDGLPAAQAHAEFVARFVDLGGRVSPELAEPLVDGDRALDSLGQLPPDAPVARMVINRHDGPTRATQQLLDLLHTTRQRAWLQTPGLVSAPMADEIERSARAGVDTRLVVTGPGTIPFLPVATRSLSPALLAANARIYETRSKLHAKAALFDDAAMVGSLNLTPRALGTGLGRGDVGRDMEAAVAVRGRHPLLEQLAASMERDMGPRRSHALTPEDVRRGTGRIITTPAVRDALLWMTALLA